jgi:hypothetical protein
VITQEQPARPPGLFEHHHIVCPQRVGFLAGEDEHELALARQMIQSLARVGTHDEPERAEEGGDVAHLPLGQER